MGRRVLQSAARFVVPALWVALPLVVLADVIWALRQGDVSVDFLAVRGAGSALLDGRSVYADPTFVYPPTAALVFTPLTLGSAATTYRAFLLVELAALLGAALLMRTATRRGRWGLSTVLPALVMASSPLTLCTLPLGNASLLFAPVAVAVVAAFARARWTLGCAVLVASLLVKPLLIPLLLVPLVARRPRPLLLTGVPAGLVLVLAGLLVPGGREVHRYVGYVAAGSNLHGSLAPLNLSLAGLVETHGGPGWAATPARLVVLSVAAALAVRLARRSLAPVDVCRLAVLAFAVTLLAGRLSESHYLPVLLALVLLRLVAAPSGAAVGCHLPGLALLCVAPSIAPAGWSGPADQNWFVAAELLAFVGVAADLLLANRNDRSAQSGDPGVGAGDELAAVQRTRVRPATATHPLDRLVAPAARSGERRQHRQLLGRGVAADHAQHRSARRRFVGHGTS